MICLYFSILFACFVYRYSIVDPKEQKYKEKRMAADYVRMRLMSAFIRYVKSYLSKKGCEIIAVLWSRMLGRSIIIFLSSYTWQFSHVVLYPKIWPFDVTHSTLCIIHVSNLHFTIRWSDRNCNFELWNICTMHVFYSFQRTSISL